uniref:PPPDE domain-containing protein n=1 Tax=Panagrolaimus sp. ES5 TaxID=591445 RepID=A0AC34FZD1_9BILA
MPPRAIVKLNVYDMYWINDYASVLGIGVYHSGVEIHGVEYAYGGHPFEFSGIFENQPGDAEELGENFKFKETQICGETDFTAYEIKKIVQQLGEDYRGDKYHLITKNCNHFSQMLVKMLTGTDIPPWINRLASMSGSIPFFERIVPAEYLTPVALQQSLEENNKKPEEPVTMNYPVEDAQEALEGHPNTSKNSSNFSGISNGSSSIAGKSRRSSKEDSSLFNGSRSTPTSARSAPSSSGLTKLWNSIKSIGADTIPAVAVTATNSTPNTPPPIPPPPKFSNETTSKIYPKLPASNETTVSSNGIHHPPTPVSSISTSSTQSSHSSVSTAISSTPNNSKYAQPNGICKTAPSNDE